MKIDLIYPKIPENTNGFLDKCIAFEKYDGTNLHWCWNLQEGWHKFGTRRTQFHLNRAGIAEFSQEHYELGNAPHVFNEKLRDKLTAYLSNNFDYSSYDIIVYTEFLGPNSFRGGHSEEDARNDTQDLVIIDVCRGKTIIPPQTFVEHFGHLKIADVVYIGKYSGQFTEDVRKGKFKVNEGVVCKGMVNGSLFMTKVKTDEYLKRK